MDNNIIDLSVEATDKTPTTDIPEPSNRTTINKVEPPKNVDSKPALTTSVTISVEPTEADLEMESADDILARQIQIENARDAIKKASNQQATARLTNP